MYQGVFIKEHNVLERWGVHYAQTINRVKRDEAGAIIKWGGNKKYCLCKGADLTAIPVPPCRN